MKTRTVKQIAPATRAAIRRALGRWYAENKRPLPWRRTREPYAIWVSEAMLQQTQVKTVIPYYQQFMASFPSVAALAQADQQRVLKAWEGLGYYSRARNLHRAAKLVHHELGGRIPNHQDKIRQLPGVGEYMASAILSIAFDQPLAVVDGNVKRVVARLFCVETPVNQASGHKLFLGLARQLLDNNDAGSHNQAMMELGALVCTPRNPNCRGCPVAKYCQALKSGQVQQYPKRRKRIPIQERTMVAAVVVKKGRLLLVQRPEQGLLGGLWEFPMAPLAEGDDPVNGVDSYLKEATGLTVAVQQHIVTVRHAYTHFKILLQVYRCPWRGGRVRLMGPQAFRWVSVIQLTDFALHGAMHKIIPWLHSPD